VLAFSRPRSHFPPRRGQSFSPAERDPLPFLVPVKPVDPAPVCPALDAGAVRARSRRGGVGGQDRAGRIASARRPVGNDVGRVCLGAQHIAHTREKHALGRQLRQKEIELRAITQAYRSLEAQKELLARKCVPGCGGGCEGACRSGGRVGQRSRSGGGPQGKAVPARASSDVPSNRRSQVANARPVSAPG